MNSEPESTLTETTPPSSPPSKPRFPVLIVFPVGLIVCFIWILVTFTLPELFLSQARVRLGREFSGSPLLTRSAEPSGYDLSFVLTEIGVIQSATILTNVIGQLNLNQEWGKRYFPGGKPFLTGESLSRLKAMLEVWQVPNTSLIDIGVFSDQPEEAASLANAVASAYKRYRVDERKRQTLYALQSLFDGQGEQVRQARQALDELGRVPANGAQLDEAERRLEEALSLRSTLHEKLASEQIQAAMPGAAMVEIVESARPVYKAIRPNKALNIVIGIMGGLFLGLVVATGVYGWSFLTYRRALTAHRRRHGMKREDVRGEDVRGRQFWVARAGGGG